MHVLAFDACFMESKDQYAVENGIFPFHAFVPTYGRPLGWLQSPCKHSSSRLDPLPTKVLRCLFENSEWSFYLQWQYLG